jgi:hypothetical protein
MAASPIIEPNAQMAKLVDAPASGAGDRKVVEVRVLFSLCCGGPPLEIVQFSPYLYCT